MLPIMGYGDGTVRWDEPRQRWVGRYEKHGGRARRQRGWVSSRSEAECRRKLAKAIQTSATLPAYDGRLRLDTFLGRWLDEMQSGIRAVSADQHRSRVETHIAPRLGGHRLVDLRVPHIAAFRDDLVDSGLAPRTVNHVLGTLRYALAKAVEWRMVERNEASFVKGPHVPQGDTQPLTTAQAAVLLRHVEGDDWEAIYVLAVRLGMRQSEILGLRWRDVVDTRIEVRKTLTWLHGRATLEDPKTERSHRTITLPREAARAIKARLAMQEGDRAISNAWSPFFDNGYDLVFTDRDGYAIERTQVTRAFQRHLATTGLPKVAFHSTRATAITRMHELGMTMREIADVVGHSKPSMTSDTYTYLGDTASIRAAELLDGPE